MKKPEKVAAELLDELGIDWQGTGSQKVGEMERRDAIASVATALRAARNEGLEEGAALCEWAVETAGLPETRTFAGDARSNVRRAALALAAAIRSKKDAGNG